MSETVILCWRSRTWARSIGYVQLITAALFIWATLRELLEEAAVEEKSDQRSSEEEEEVDDNFRWAILVFSFQLSIHFVSMAMATILLRGSYIKNGELIGVWIFFSVIAAVLRMVVILPLVYRFDYEDQDFHGQTIRYSMSFLFDIFSLWVVYTHKKEVEASVSSKQRLNDSDISI